MPPAYYFHLVVMPSRRCHFSYSIFLCLPDRIGLVRSYGLPMPVWRYDAACLMRHDDLSPALPRERDALPREAQNFIYHFIYEITLFFDGARERYR